MKEQILEVVLKMRGQTKAEIIKKTETGRLVKQQEYVLTRQLFYYFCKKYTKSTLKDLELELGQDHATVIHAVKTIKNDMKYSAKLRNEVRKIDEVMATLIFPEPTVSLFPTMKLRWFNSRLQQKYIGTDKEEVWLEVEEVFEEQFKIK